MKFYLSIIFILINCAVSTAQSFHFKGLDLDTGANLVRNVYFDKATKSSVSTTSSLLWHRLDSFERYKMINHFIKLDSNSNVILDKPYQKNNINTDMFGTLKLKQDGYLAYGLEYDTKKQSQGFNEVLGCIIRYNEQGDSLFSKYFYYENANSSIYSIRQLKDSSFVLLSRLSNNQNLFSALRIIKLDTAFNILYDNVFYYSDYTNLNVPKVLNFHDAVEETPDEGLLIGTELFTRNALIQYHALLFKIDKNGIFQWERKYEFDRDMETKINKIIKLQDGNFMLVGYYNEFWKDPKIKDKIFLIKVSSTGELISKKLIHAYESQYIYLMHW